MPFNNFQIHAHDRAVRLITDEQLVSKRAKLASRVASQAAGRLSHLVVRKQNGCRDQVFVLGSFGHDATIILGINGVTPANGAAFSAQRLPPGCPRTCPVLAASAHRCHSRDLGCLCRSNLLQR